MIKNTTEYKMNYVKEMRMDHIHSMKIDSSDATTYMCLLGKACGTDKTPLNDKGHRHPYTAIYSLLFSRFAFQPVRFAEIGIAGGASGLLWRHFFSKGQLYLFDRDENYINNLKNYSMPDLVAAKMDVADTTSIHNALAETGGNLDILLDDSSHGFEDQIRIIHAGIPFVSPGGMIIIEDVFRQTSEDDYRKALEDVMHHFSFATFIIADHTNRWYGTWDNDKLLLLIKK